MPRLLVHDEADADVDEIADHLAQDNLDVAIRFLHTVRQSYEKLLFMPGMGALRSFPNPRYVNVRSWPITGFDNYLIFYAPTSEGIEIFRILHGARNIERFFE
jgi:toxin ParE1/3/4